MRIMKAKTVGFLALSAVVAACSHNSGSAAGASQAAVGKAAPSWQEQTTTGKSLSMESLRGKAVYLNFFASWCPPCNEEAPDVNSLQSKYGAQGLQVVGVDVLENKEKAAYFVSEHHLKYPAVIDEGTLRDAYNVNGLPVHVFIDRQGVVRKILVGELSRSQMEAAVKSVL